MNHDMNYDQKNIDLWDGNFPISDTEDTTWHKALEMAAGEYKDNIIAWTKGTEALVTDCDSKWTAWSIDWVYFPAGLDGCHWIARVPRHPCNMARTATIGQL